MATSSLAPRLTDILEAIERIRAEMAGVKGCRCLNSMHP
jgi:hypothetical protein